MTTLPSKTVVATSLVTSELAIELAAGLTPMPEIMKRFSLDKAQLQTILKDPHFQQLYKEAKAVWHGAENIQERIRAKSKALVEDSLLPVYSIIHNPDMAPAARLDAFGKLVRVADLEPKKDAGGGAASFHLTIEIPGEKPVTIEAEPIYDGESG